MSKIGALKVVAGIATSFVGIAGIIIFLSVSKIINSSLAMLMIISLFGLYLGFGVLIAVYRLTSKLE